MNIFHIKRQIVDAASQQGLPWQYNIETQVYKTQQHHKQFRLRYRLKANNINNSRLLNDLHG